MFKKVPDICKDGILLDDHAGGCVLYEKRDLVEQLIN
jgi:hypothetical protein